MNDKFSKPSVKSSDRTILEGVGAMAPSKPPFVIPRPKEGETRTPMTVLPRPSLKEGEVHWIHTNRTRLEILDQIGEGGAGEVMVALDHDIGRKVAIKKIRAEAMSAYMIARFIEEIRTIGRLEHPNIIPIHDVGVDEKGDLYFVMKYVEGVTLAAIIERLKNGDLQAHKTYNYERRVEIFRGLLEAVRYAHARNTLHRDIKPENVMVGPFGEVLLMDWGIARELDDEQRDQLNDTLLPDSKDADNSFWRTSDGGLIGTPLYMSPEQAQGRSLDVRSDVYSLGVLFFELLTLRHYIKNDEETTIEKVLFSVTNYTPSLRVFNMNIPGGPVPMDLVWFTRKGMAKAKEERFQSVAEMIERLDKRAEGLVPVQCHLTLNKRILGSLLRFTERHPMLATFSMMAGLGFAVAGAVLLFTV